jgi:hypothetical protein
VVAEFLVLLIVELVPCQYQVTPDGGVERVKVFAPHVLLETVGLDGTAGTGLTVTYTLASVLQQPVLVFLARM